MTDLTYTVIRRGDLPALYRDLPVPPLEKLQDLKVGEAARIAVRVRGGHYPVDGVHIFPWVRIVEGAAGDYVGEVGGISNSPDWLAYGTLVNFGAVSIIETDYLPGGDPAP